MLVPIALVALFFLWILGVEREGWVICDTFDVASYDIVNSPNPPGDIAVSVVSIVAGVLVVVAIVRGWGRSILSSGRSWAMVALTQLVPLVALYLIVQFFVGDDSSLWDDCGGSIKMTAVTIPLLLTPAALGYGLGRWMRPTND